MISQFMFFTLGGFAFFWAWFYGTAFFFIWLQSFDVLLLFWFRCFWFWFRVFLLVMLWSWWLLFAFLPFFRELRSQVILKLVLLVFERFFSFSVLFFSMQQLLISKKELKRSNGILFFRSTWFSVPTFLFCYFLRDKEL